MKYPYNRLKTAIKIQMISHMTFKKQSYEN